MLTIDPEFKNLIPELTDSEYDHLEESIKDEGCRFPITHWHGVIVDGHHRYEICKRLGISFKVEEKSFSCREEVISWICLNQLSRRNLTEEARKYLIGKRYEAEKSLCYQRNSRGVNQYSKPRIEGDGLINPNVVRRTSMQIGDEYHLGHSTVERYGKYSRLVDEIGKKDPAIIPQLLSGELSLSYDNTLRLSMMNKPDIDALKSQLAFEKRFVASPSSMSGHPKPMPMMRKKQNDQMPALQVNVKTKPTYDPDAEINGLTMTIPAWMNSISRVKENIVLDLVSIQARDHLVSALKELQEAVEKILQKVGA